MKAVRAGIAMLVAAGATAGGTGRSGAAALAQDHLRSTAGGPGSVAPPVALRPGTRPARRIEELAGQVGARRLREIRARAVADLNRGATATFGPFDQAKAEILGRRDYFADRDVDVFVTASTPSDRSYLAVPLGTIVTEAGEVVVPAGDPDAYGAPAFGGPWGTATTSFFTATNTDGGGASCGPTTAHNILRASWRKLADVSPTRDYWGIDLASLAEVTETSGCNDFVDDARIGFRSTTGGGLVVAEDPASGRAQGCATRTLTVGSSWGGVSASVSQAFTHCERVGVSGAFQPAGTTRTVVFDNNGNCHAGDVPYDGRELGQVGVVEVPQGSSHGLLLSLGVNAGNASTCKENQC